MARHVKSAAAQKPAAVRCGVDVLRDSVCRLLEGNRVGLITNHTGRDAQGTPTAKALVEAGVKLITLFSPEHGYAGVEDGLVGDSTEPSLGLPVHSLYGETRRPLPEWLEGLDTLLFDIQDVGARFYTYITTMAYCLEACAQQGLRFVVLDRPNPIGGHLVEGPPIDDDLRSFVGYLRVPIRHGMTVGEIARLHVAQESLDAQLDIVPMSGWRRRVWFDWTGLSWVPPSPALRTLEAAIAYPGLCLLERMNLSLGRGTATPFLKVGAPWLEAEPLAEDLNTRGLQGVRFEPCEFVPTRSVHRDALCRGVAVGIVNRDLFRAVTTGLHLIDAIHRQNPVELDLGETEGLLGSRAAVGQLKAFVPPEAIVVGWQDRTKQFLRERVPFLVYEW